VYRCGRRNEHMKILLFQQISSKGFHNIFILDIILRKIYTGVWDTRFSLGFTPSCPFPQISNQTNQPFFYSHKIHQITTCSPISPVDDLGINPSIFISFSFKNAPLYPNCWGFSSSPPRLLDHLPAYRRFITLDLE